MPSRPNDEIVMYSTGWCGDCRRARAVFREAGVPFREINIDREPEAQRLVMRLNRGMRSVPTILFPDDSVLVEPSSSELRHKLRQLES